MRWMILTTVLFFFFVCHKKDQEAGGADGEDEQLEAEIGRSLIVYDDVFK
jgi:hypothetical protein